MDYSNGRIQGAGNLKVRKRYFEVHKRYFYGVYVRLPSTAVTGLEIQLC